MLARRFTLASTLFATLVVSSRMAWSATPAAPPVDGIEKIVTDDLKQGKCASYAVAVVKDGRLVLARGYGMPIWRTTCPPRPKRFIDWARSPSSSPPWRSCSWPKQGKLSVDDELTKFLPDYPTQDQRSRSTICSITPRASRATRASKDFFQASLGKTLARRDAGAVQGRAVRVRAGRQVEVQQLGLLPAGHDHREGQRRRSTRSICDEHIFKPLGDERHAVRPMRPLIRHRAMGYRNRGGQLVNDDRISMTRRARPGRWSRPCSTW